MGPHCLQKSTLNLGKETKISTRGRIKSYARLEGIFRPHSFGLKRLSQRGKLRGEVSIRAIAESSPEMVKSIHFFLNFFRIFGIFVTSSNVFLVTIKWKSNY